MEHPTVCYGNAGSHPPFQVDFSHSNLYIFWEIFGWAMFDFRRENHPLQMGAFPATAWTARMPLATCIGFVPWRWWLDWCSVGLAASWRTLTQLKICNILQASKYLKIVTFVIILLYTCVILNTTLFLEDLWLTSQGDTRPRRPRLCGLDVHHTLDAHRARDFGWRAADANNYFNCCWAKYVEAYYYSKEV